MFKPSKKTAAWNMAFAAMATTGSMGITIPALADSK